MSKYQRKTVDATDHQIGQDGVVAMPPTGPARLIKPAAQEVEGPRGNVGSNATAILAEVPKGVEPSYFEDLAFNNELVTVVVHESTEKYAEPLVQTWVNGRHQLFPRGQDITCKRMFVERLARAKVTGYGNVEYVDPEGNRAMRYPSSTGLKYAFSVVRDDNPNGRAWLKKILAEA